MELARYLGEILEKANDPWAVWGFVGQAFFFSRFIVQWIASERAGRSTIPYSFWVLSVIGTVMLASYAFFIKNPVFILAYTPNVFIYVRNMMLVKREERRLREASRIAP